MKCNKCGHEMQVISDTRINTKHRGCLMWLVWLFLALCTCGLILIIPLLTNTKVKGKTYNYLYCPNCGNKKRI